VGGGNSGRDDPTNLRMIIYDGTLDGRHYMYSKNGKFSWHRKNINICHFPN
jgi:hypothetical protein